VGVGGWMGALCHVIVYIVIGRSGHCSTTELMMMMMMIMMI
jgi:hypothetical protein